MSKRLLTELRCKSQKQMQMTQKSRDVVLSCRDGAKKAKANLKLNLAKKTKKGFYKFQTSNFIKIIER